MAIIPNVPGITVSIHLGDSPEPLAEYPDNDNDPSVTRYIARRTTSCYIQSTPGTPFSFHVKIEPPYAIDCPYLGFWYCVNDNDGDAELYGPGHFSEDGILTDVIEGHAVVDYTGSMKMRMFSFCKLDVTDDDNHQTLLRQNGSEKEMQKHIGSLEVYIYRMKDGDIKPPEPTTQQPDIKEIHEKILKGQSLSCSVELDEKHHEGNVEHQAAEYMDCVEKPVAVFKFKYRSKEDLQKEFITPRTPSSSPSPSPPPTSKRTTFDDLAEDEIRTLAELAHKQRSILRKISARTEGVEYVEVSFADLPEEDMQNLAKIQFAIMNAELPPADMLVSVEPSVNKERIERHERARFGTRDIIGSNYRAKKVVIDLTLESDSDADSDSDSDEDEEIAGEGNETVYEAEDGKIAEREDQESAGEEDKGSTEEEKEEQEDREAIEEGDEELVKEADGEIIEEDDEDDEEGQEQEVAEEEPPQEVIISREGGSKRKQRQVSVGEEDGEEDEVLFLSERRVKKSRKEQNVEEALRSRVKSETPFVA